MCGWEGFDLMVGQGREGDLRVNARTPLFYYGKFSGPLMFTDGQIVRLSS